MKWLALIPVFWASLAQGPTLPFGFVPQAASSPCAPFTDSFSGSGALNATYWTNVPSLAISSGTVVQNSGVAQASGAYKAGAAVVAGCTPSSTPYVQWTISSLLGSGNNQGFVLDMTTSGTGYLGILWPPQHTLRYINARQGHALSLTSLAVPAQHLSLGRL